MKTAIAIVATATIAIFAYQYGPDIVRKFRKKPATTPITPSAGA